MRVLEIVVAMALVSVAPLLLLVGWGPIRNLFEEYQDNDPWAYVLFGAPFWLAAIVCLVGAAFLLMHAGRRSRRVEPD